jgi:hypothetical protein
MITKNIQDALTRVYSILKFTEAETDDALGDLAGIQQVAVATELVKMLNEEEIKTLNGLAEKSEVEKKAAMEQIVKVRATDSDFKYRAQAAAKKVLDEHIAYLKTRGDDNQKQAINKILAEIK